MLEHQPMSPPSVDDVSTHTGPFFISEPTFRNNGAHPLWRVDEGNQMSAAYTVARSIERTLSEAAHVISIRKPGLGETHIFEAEDTSVKLWIQNDKDKENSEYRGEFSGRPHVSVTFGDGNFSLSMGSGENDEPLYQDVVTAEFAEKMGFLLSIGKVEVKRLTKYHHQGGIALQSFVSEGSKGYKHAKACISQTKNELQKGEINKDGLYYELLSESRGILRYREIHSGNTEIVEEVQTVIVDPQVFVAYGDSWYFRHIV